MSGTVLLRQETQQCAGFLRGQARPFGRSHVQPCPDLRPIQADAQSGQGLKRRSARCQQPLDACTPWYDAPMPSTKVSSKHQVTLPSEARRRLGIQPGDRLSVEVTEDALVLRVRPARPSVRLRGLGRGSWAGLDPVEEIRTLREQADEQR
jgi:AbrB family looped-hinge helix DNA binding protein